VLRAGDVKMDGLMLFTLFWGVVTFTLMFVWLVIHRQRVITMEDVIESRGLDTALEARRREGQAV
jgi:heme exporter protein C